jgi:hypothetical protein
MDRFRASVLFLCALFFLVLTSLVSLPAFAQSQNQASAAPAAPSVYDATKEVVLQGTISSVVTRPKGGLPLGLHLMLETAQGQVDVHLGPYYGNIAAEKGLVAGATIQVTGMTSHFKGGDVFLARIIVAGGQTLTIRSQRGFPVRPAAAGTRAVRGAQTSGGL